MTGFRSAIGPARYAAGRASPLGAATEAIEREAMVALAGEGAGRRRPGIGCGDGVLAAVAAKQGGQTS